jgi:hypothetical protein
MTDENQNRECQAGKPDAFDRELDAALAKYAVAEPRAGLEQRILANLRAEREQVHDRSTWRWAFAAALAGVIIVGVLNLKSHKPTPSLVPDHPSATTAESQEPGTQVISNREVGGVRVPVHGSTRKARSQRANPAAAATEPKLDHFPSRQPLSAQELALARYVSEFPQEAAVIARVQEEYEKEIQRAMKDARAETDSYVSDQQER